MAKEKLLLINLNEEKTKKISEIISSNTSRKILDYLAEKDDTEANISKNLSIPISTIHYHLQKLMEAGLVVVEEFHYSKKGREVNHYKLANKYIIITPKPVSGIKRALKSILPVALITLGISAVIKIISLGLTFKASTKMAMEKVTAPLAEEAAMAYTPVITQKPDIALWFLVGGFTAMAIYLVIALIREWRKNK